jgi:uncharacterized membrane protein
VFRAYQIAHGGLVGSGASIDAGIDELYSLYTHLMFAPQVRTTAEKESTARKIRWTGRDVYREFSNTAANPPIGYLPQALGIAIGKAADMSVFNTLLLSRLLNGAFAIVVSALALCICRRGRFVMFTLLLMPMTLSLFASCNQDAMLISVAAMAFALVSRVVAEGRPASPRTSALLAACLTFVALARPPYSPLLLLLLIPGLLPAWGRKPAWVSGIALVGLLAILTAIWVTAFAFTPAAKLGQAHGADPGAQLLYVVRNMDAVPGLVLATFIRNGVAYVLSLIGVLGWFDTRFSSAYYGFAAIALLAALVAEATHDEEGRPRATAIVFLAVLAAGAALFFTEYLIWNPVGHPMIDGVQGRYLIPLAMAAGIGLPRLARLDWAGRVARTAVVLFPLATLYYLPPTIIGRYYPGG